MSIELVGFVHVQINLFCVAWHCLIWSIVVHVSVNINLICIRVGMHLAIH